MNYYARLDENNKPIILYRATPDMEEEIWTGSWEPAEFLLDVLEGHGRIYPVEISDVKGTFPSKAFE